MPTANFQSSQRTEGFSGRQGDDAAQKRMMTAASVHTYVAYNGLYIITVHILHRWMRRMSSIHHCPHWSLLIHQAKDAIIHVPGLTYCMSNHFKYQVLMCRTVLL